MIKKQKKQKYSKYKTTKNIDSENYCNFCRNADRFFAALTWYFNNKQNMNMQILFKGIYYTSYSTTLAIF